MGYPYQRAWVPGLVLLPIQLLTYCRPQRQRWQLRCRDLCHTLGELGWSSLLSQLWLRLVPVVQAIQEVYQHHRSTLSLPLSPCVCVPLSHSLQLSSKLTITGLGWAMHKPSTWNSIWVCHVDAGTHGLGPSTTAFPGSLTGKQGAKQLCTHPGSSLTYCSTTPVPAFLFTRKSV